MICRPASRSRAMNGVVFQTSTAMMAASDVVALAIQATGLLRIPRRLTRMSLMTPLSWLYMNRQSWLETTVGMAQGMSIDVRTTPRPVKLELMISAMAIPSTVSMATDTTVKVTVCPNALMKVLSLNKRTQLSNPTYRSGRALPKRALVKLRRTD